MIAIKYLPISFAFVFLFIFVSSVLGAEGNAKAGPLRLLSLSDTLRLAHDNNLLMKMASQQVLDAAGRKQIKDADLFPHISLAASQMRVYKEDLDALGFPGGGMLGPFNTLDARAELSWRVFDLSAISRHQEGIVEYRLAGFEQNLAHQQVTTIAVWAYLAVLKAQESLHAIAEDALLAKQILTLAHHQFDDGLAPAIDVTRAQARLSQEEFLYQQGDLNLEKSLLHLKHITGLPLGDRVVLTDKMKFFGEKVLPLTEAVNTALNQRVEIQISGQEVQFAKDKLNEARAENLPKVLFVTDFGRAGTDVSQKTQRVSEIGVRVKMPIFDGGAIRGDVKEAAAKKEEKEILKDDTQIQVEQDVRLALKTLLSTKKQVVAARETVFLANQELKEARNRLTSGISDNLEVITAQTRLAQAKESYEEALTLYHLARMNYYSAIGDIEHFYL
ncbi:MAG: TolC family protein [Candidatus Omnitrophica bacterium]|nr:TolC family protein [Candidatus Omnitrophota bacterium]